MNLNMNSNMNLDTNFIMILMYTLCILAGLAILTLLWIFVTYMITFYSSRRRCDDVYDLPKGDQYKDVQEFMYSLSSEMEEIPYEQIFITATDGTKLAARYYHVADQAPLQIQFHGYRGNAIRDFCGGNKITRELGHNTLLVDQRAHGLSGGHSITFGIKEREDCLCWINYANTRFGQHIPIFLAGISMGAATVLMATALKLPPNIAGIIADCPYSSPRAIIHKVCRDMKIPADFVLPFISLGARLFAHIDIDSCTAIEAVAHTDIPILLLHGEEDRFVPSKMSEELQLACASSCKRETFYSAGHGLSCLVEHDRYRQILTSFIGACLAS